MHKIKRESGKVKSTMCKIAVIKKYISSTYTLLFIYGFKIIIKKVSEKNFSPLNTFDLDGNPNDGTLFYPNL